MNTGFIYAIIAAIFYAASVPATKYLLRDISGPFLAGLCYLGSGLGLGIFYFLRSLTEHRREAGLSKEDFPWLLGTILAGGIAAPLLFFAGLKHAKATDISILLNFEVILTSVIAGVVFREEIGFRVWLAAAVLTLAAFVLSFSGSWTDISFEPAFLPVIASCLLWALDNNLARHISSKDPVPTAMLKGLTAGTVNLVVGFAYGTGKFAVSGVAAGLLVGALSYGASLALFILAMRQLGAARAAAALGIYPFAGVILSVLTLGEPLTPQLCISSGLAGFALWLLYTEKHVHIHRHELLTHEHLHTHDEHHNHSHSGEAAVCEPHSHPHAHQAMEHSHEHTPDIHHRH